jgi:hypothetical protein
MTWSWPTTPDNGVYDFDAINYGDYDGTVVQNPIASTPVNNLGTLTETHSLAFSGTLEGYDAIIDMFLTTTPEDSNTNAAEIEVFLHTPTYAAQYVQSQTPVGTFQGSGITWTVTVDHGGGESGLDLLIMPSDQADVSSGTIDLKAMLQYLVSKGVLSGNLFFNGLGVGTETNYGSGSMVVNSLSVTYK